MDLVILLAMNGYLPPEQIDQETLSPYEMGMFVSLPGLVMVLGGTLANAFISYQGVYVLAAMKDCFTIYGHSKVNRSILMDEVKKVLEWADIVSKKGIVGLDQHLKDHKSDDHLVDYAIDILLSGYKPDNVRELLTNTIESAFERATLRVKVLENMAATAPAFGMIGTLVGLVIMLSQLDSNPQGIGAGLAIALLTTLYGVLAARLVFQPAGTKVLHREELLRMRNYILLELFVMLAEEKRELVSPHSGYAGAGRWRGARHGHALRHAPRLRGGHRLRPRCARRTRGIARWCFRAERIRNSGIRWVGGSYEAQTTMR